MKLTTTAPLLNFAGKPLLEEAGSDKAATLGGVLVAALCADEPNLSGAKKFERGKLAKRLYTDGEVSVTAEEVVVLKECVGRIYPPLVVLRVFEALEGE